MWAATTASPSPSCRRRTLPTKPPSLPAIYAKSPPPKTHAESATPDNNRSVKSLGHTILSAVKSPLPNRKQGTPKQESEAEAEAGQVRGSDVLWALQKAAAAKEKNRSRRVNDKKKKEGPAAFAEPQNSGINRGVRPLRIGSDWGFRLSELEKRLQEISDPV